MARRNRRGRGRAAESEEVAGPAVGESVRLLDDGGPGFSAAHGDVRLHGDGGRAALRRQGEVPEPNGVSSRTEAVRTVDGDRARRARQRARICDELDVRRSGDVGGAETLIRRLIRKGERERLE